MLKGYLSVPCTFIHLCRQATISTSPTTYWFSKLHILKLSLSQTQLRLKGKAINIIACNWSQYLCTLRHAKGFKVLISTWLPNQITAHENIQANFQQQSFYTWYVYCWNNQYNPICFYILYVIHNIMHESE